MEYGGRTHAAVTEQSVETALKAERSTLNVER
jgi:hypothetical protein